MRLNVTLSARNLRDSQVVRHEFLKRLTTRYRRERILIPFPTRTIDAPPGLFAGSPPAGGSGR
jgi:small-conductance mechanosensitive channel